MTSFVTRCVSFMKLYERRLEKAYHTNPYIVEFWNTVSNAPLSVIGLLRYLENYGQDSTIETAYLLMICAGICSAIHHATMLKWTRLIDWIPIASMLVYSVVTWNLALLSPAVLAEIALALAVLGSDHIVKLIPVPWGHVMWHCLAALAVDAFLQNMQKVH